MISERFFTMDWMGRKDIFTQIHETVRIRMMIRIFTKNIARMVFRMNCPSGVVLWRKEKLNIPEKNESRAFTNSTCSMEPSGTPIFWRESMIPGA